MTRRGRLLRSVSPWLAGLISASAVHAAPTFPAPATVRWIACPSDLIDSEFTTASAGRLECGSLAAPLTYDAPDERRVDVGLIRVKAELPTERKGAIFFNFGGPGVHPALILPHIAAMWSVADPRSDIDGDKRRLAEQYDLIAVVPRGLRGSPTVACDPAMLKLAYREDPLVYRSPQNWTDLTQDVQALAEHCGSQFGMRHVDTGSHVGDMEYARISLGEPEMNFFGASYGTMVGSYYASLFPEHMGRFVLDSAMDLTATYEQLLLRAPAALQGAFERDAAQPALANPDYQVTERDVATLVIRLQQMPAEARRAWIGRIETPADLAAVYRMSHWFNQEWARTSAPGYWDTVGTRFLGRAETYVFSADTDINDDIRASAEKFIGLLGYSGGPEPYIDAGTYFGVICGEMPWTHSPQDWRKTANAISLKYPMAGGGTVMSGLVCRHWPERKSNRPALALLAHAKPMLMVQAEYDKRTPLDGALRTFRAMPLAYMITARGMSAHGVFGTSGTPCVEQGVGHYLLTGELPAERSTTCDFEPSPTSRHARSVGTLPPVHELREQVRERLRRS